MSDGSLPETAITAFEQVHDLLVTVYDLGGRLQQFLAPHRLQHRHPVCQAVKAGGLQRICERFEIEQVYRQLRDRPAGRVHVCHAGVVEWAVPLHRAGRIEVLLCAGARRPGSLGLRGPRRPAADLSSLAPVDAEPAALILECLCQLAARLGAWLDDLGRSPVASRRQEAPGDIHLVDRRARIVQFIHQHHTTPLTLGDLAAHLRLTAPRASAAVRRCCGMTFQELLRRQRLDTAADLLRHTTLPVVDVAIAAGFSDRSHFARSFTAHFRVSPRGYRRNGAPALPPPTRPATGGTSGSAGTRP
jgi:AraC-like DNA-binding protein